MRIKKRAVCRDCKKIRSLGPEAPMEDILKGPDGVNYHQPCARLRVTDGKIEVLPSSQGVMIPYRPDRLKGRRISEGRRRHRAYRRARAGGVRLSLGAFNHPGGTGGDPPAPARG